MHSRFSGQEYVTSFWLELQRHPGSAQTAQIVPLYPKVDGRGRPPIGLERMLRMVMARQCFGLPDEGAEDARYVSEALRGTVRIDHVRVRRLQQSCSGVPPLARTEQVTERNVATINTHLDNKGLVPKEVFVGQLLPQH